MNDDLHNIDDLFRKGIEAHEEAVPPSVWDAVSNDLNKKQVSYYRSKYYRLKWVALFLLLLCVSGGSYFVYEGLKKLDTPVSKNGGTGLSTTPNASVKEKKHADNVSTAINSNGTQEHTTTGIQNDRLVSGSGLDTINKLSLAKQSENRPVDPEEKKNANKSFLAFNAPMQTVRSKRPSIASTDLLETHDREENILNINSNASSKKTAVPLPYFHRASIAAPYYSASLIPLQELNITRKFELLARPLSSPAKSNGSKAHSVSLTAFVAPNVMFNRFEDDDHLAGPGHNRQDAHRQEQDNFSLTGGLLLTYGLLKKLNVQSGITITSSSTAIGAKTVYAEPDNRGHTRYELHCSSGYVYLAPKSGMQPAAGDSARASGTMSTITYISIPVSVSYHLGSGRFSFQPGLGVGLNLLASSKASTNLSATVTKESATSHISGLKPAYLDGYIGLGVEYSLNKKLAIGIRPNVRMALTPINKGTPVRSYQNFVSLETGVRMRF